MPDINFRKVNSNFFFLTMVLGTAEVDMQIQHEGVIIFMTFSF